MILQHFGDPGANHSAMEALSDRELEVLELIGQNNSVLNIARSLHISWPRNR